MILYMVGVNLLLILFLDVKWSRGIERIVLGLDDYWFEGNFYLVMDLGFV